MCTSKLAMQRRVVVTGMGVLSPLGLNLKESWQAIIDNKSGISSLNENFQHLPCRIGGVIMENGQPINLTSHFNKSELKTMSRSTAYALIAAQEAIRDAKLENLPNHVKHRTGVAVGIGMIDMDEVCQTYEAAKKSFKQISPFFLPKVLANMAAGQISIKYGFHGPNHTVSTACASGVHSIGDAFRFIINSDADVMVCGASEAAISPLTIASFCRLRALSTSFNDTPQIASRPFDKKREGFVMGEGSAILVLEDLEHAKNRKVDIYAEILGYGLSGDASHLTAPHPDGLGAKLAMERAIKSANVQLEDVSYINAHATSTPLGDTIEVKAIKSLFGDKSDNLAISSTKGAHGHLMGAAGNLETVFTIKALQEGILPPTLNLEEVDVAALNYIRKQIQKWSGNRKRIALKNSFGFGGTNSSLCIGQFL